MNELALIHVKFQGKFMENDLTVDAIIAHQSAVPTSPILAVRSASESILPTDLALESRPTVSDQYPTEITTNDSYSPDSSQGNFPVHSVTLNGIDQLDSSNLQTPYKGLAGSVLQWLEPEKIRVGRTPNRSPEAYEDEAFDGLCASMAIHGNTQPIQVYAVKATEESEFVESYVLISGERRLRAAISNQQLVLAAVIDDSKCLDVELLALTENLTRADLSPFEWGRQLIHVMQVKPAYNVSRLAKISGRHKSVISRAIELASLPVEIVQAFTSVRDLRYADAKPLLTAYQKSRENVIVEAELIKAEAEDLKGPAVVKRLVAAAEGTVAPCNTSEPIPIRFEDREVGALSATKGGGSQLLITIEISEQQRKALALHVEQFVSSRVLRASDASAEKVGLKKRSKANSVKSASNLTQTITTQNGA